MTAAKSENKEKREKTETRESDGGGCQSRKKKLGRELEGSWAADLGEKNEMMAERGF